MLYERFALVARNRHESETETSAQTVKRCTDAVPTALWHDEPGGYQVLKKWLSCRERVVLDRPLTPEEVRHFADATRRIWAMVLVTASDFDTSSEGLRFENAT